MSDKVEKVETALPKTETVEGQKETQEEPKIKTVEELKAENERLEKALKERNKEEASRRKKLEELEAKEVERENASKSELQKAQDRADKAEAEARASKLSLLRRDVVAETKLPADLADFLKGETPEELKASAEILLKAIPPQQPPKLDKTNPGQLQTGLTDDEMRDRLGLGHPPKRK